MATKLSTVISSLVAAHIDDPTHEMRVAFRKLPSAHKWLLFTILESGDRPSFLSQRKDMQKLETRYDLLCPAKTHQVFATVLEEVSEGFVQIIRQQNVAVGVTWIHPSCQDLTIEELARSPKERHRFLSLCTRDGLEKAMAVAGGNEGKRVLPLLITDDDWHTLKKRCVSFLGTQIDIVSLLCSSLSSLALSTPKPPTNKLDKLRDVIVTLWPNYLQLVKATPPTSPLSLHQFFEMRRIAKASASAPNLVSIWQDSVEDIVQTMKDDYVIEEAEASLKSFHRIAKLVSQNEPDFWKVQETRELYSKALSSIVSRAEEEIGTYPDHYEKTADALEQAAKENANLAEHFDELRDLPDVDDATLAVFDEAQSYFSSRSDSLSEQASERSPDDDDRNEVFDAAAEIEGRDVTLGKLFEDL